MNLLFIGNSATYVHEIPQTLAKLCAEQGYNVTTSQLTPGGYMLSQHADETTEHGQKVLAEIAKGYDIVFLQDNGNCIATKEKATACHLACDKLINAIRAHGARPMLYVRPPYGKPLADHSPLAQCQKLDALFSDIAGRHGVDCVFVNRAFAQAIQNTEIELWGPDHAHTSPAGAYLAVCTFYATLFGRSATELDTNGLPPDEARVLQSIADRVAQDSNRYTTTKKEN